MKITKQQLRRIIRESMEPMTPRYVRNSLMDKIRFGPRKGMTRMQVVLDALDVGSPRAAAGGIMDALWIDDPSQAAEMELEDLMILGLREDELIQAVADWGTRHFRTNFAG